MRIGRASASVLALAGSVLALAPATALAGSWGADLTIPGSTAASFGGSTNSVGLADDGGAVVAWNDATDTRVATRESTGGPWTVTTLGAFDGPVAPPVVAMNGAGDTVIAWDRGTGINVGYRPDGGAWQATAYETGGLPSAPSVAINNAGDAVVGWRTYVPTLDQQLHAVKRTKAGGWPSAGSVELAADIADPVGATGGFVLVFDCAGQTAAAIDDAGRAMLLWSDTYSSFYDPLPSDDEELLCGMRSVTRASGGGWGVTSNLTPRPGDGSYHLTSGGGGSEPTTGVPMAAYDPASGRVIATTGYEDDAIVPNPPGFTLSFAGTGTRAARGTVAGGLTVDASTVAGGGYAERPSAGAAAGFESWAVHDNGGPSGERGRGAVATAGGGLALQTLTTGIGPAENAAQSPLALLTDVGGDGTGFFVFNALEFPVVATSRYVNAWTQPAGGAPSAPVKLFTAASNGIRGVGLAANCKGDALVAAAVIGGQTHYRDYSSGNSACGPAPSNPGGGGGGGGGATTAPKQKAKCKAKGKGRSAAAAKKKGCKKK